MCAKEQQRDISKVFHRLQARQKINTIPPEQVLIQKHEVRFAGAQEFQGRHTIRSDDDLVASLLCQFLTKL